MYDDSSANSTDSSSPTTVRRLSLKSNTANNHNMSTDPDKILSSKDFLPQQDSLSEQKMDGKEGQKPNKGRPPSAAKQSGSKQDSRATSREEEEEDEDEYDEINVAKIEGIYNPDDYASLNVTPEVKELFAYITQYQLPPLNSVNEVKLHPFIPDYYPSVGDIDAFIKVIAPDVKESGLGIKVLDEPAPFQSDPSILELQLRALAKQSSAKTVLIKKVENLGKNTKVIENWIKDISDLHKSKPSPSVHYSKPMPDIDSLLQEWPPEVEEKLKDCQFPGPDLNCDLATYADMVCGILDIPVYKSRVQSLHMLFTLYTTMKQFSSQFNNSMMLKQEDLISGDDGVDHLHIS